HAREDIPVSPPALAQIKENGRGVVRGGMLDAAATTCDPLTLRRIYQSTRGYCHGCRRKLAFAGFARAGVRGAWDIDGRALRPVCRACLAAPPRRERPPPRRRPDPPAKAAAPAFGHMLLGGLLGALLGGPLGALLGALLGVRLDAEPT